jgi:hypothetical protein
MKTIQLFWIIVCKCIDESIWNHFWLFFTLGILSPVFLNLFIFILFSILVLICCFLIKYWLQGSCFNLFEFSKIWFMFMRFIIIVARKTIKLVNRLFWRLHTIFLLLFHSIWQGRLFIYRFLLVCCCFHFFIAW